MRILLSLFILISFGMAQAAEDGLTPLMRASVQGQTAQVQKLIRKKKTAKLDAVDKEGHTALYLAMDNDKEDIALKLIDAGTDLSLKFDEFQESYLAIAIRYNLSRAVTKIATKNPGLINQTDTAGMTPLMRSVRNSSSEVIEFLLKNGAQKELKNSQGQTALDIAKKAQNQDAIRLLSNK
jgi:ankyrin repeat protein